MRLLTEKDIECRVARVNQYGVALLLYKNARVDMSILDEEYGELWWQRSHEVIDGRLYCTVSVYNSEIGQWISKQDVGTESNTEKEKGQASDSFKRACFNIGIGRELYTAPDIWIDADKVNIKEYNGSYKCYEKFHVSEIGYNDNREITYLVIKKDDGNTVFEYASKELISERTFNLLGEYITEYSQLVKKKNPDVIKVLMEKYCIKDLDKISEAMGFYLIKVVKTWIEKTKEKEEKKEKKDE